MTDKQVLVAVAGSAVSFVAALLLIGAIAFQYEAGGGHSDGGDDGLALLAIGFCLLCAVVGLFRTAKWARRRFPEFEA